MDNVWRAILVRPLSRQYQTVWYDTGVTRGTRFCSVQLYDWHCHTDEVINGLALL